MATYIQIPSHLSNQTAPLTNQEIYNKELHKAERFSLAITVYIYAVTLIGHLAFFFFVRPAYLFEFAHVYLTDLENEIPIEGARNRIAELISQYGENHQLVAKQRKLVKVLEEIDGLARNIGLTLKFYYSPKASGSYASATRRNCIQFNASFLEMDQDEMEGILAHEVQHLHQNHLFKLSVLEIAMWAIDFFIGIMMIPSISWSLVAVFAFETVAFFVESFALRHFEKKADLRAMDLVGTNQGLSKFFEREIQLMDIQLRGHYYIPRAIQVPIYVNEGLSSDQIFNIHKARMYSEPTHPWTSERLDYCRNYVPAAS